uniref:Uncharacterized protein n=1 Tax=Arundo donax TaxID=35708 RepID=A0A0A9DA56_ARUDO
MRPTTTRLKKAVSSGMVYFISLCFYRYTPATATRSMFSVGLSVFPKSCELCTVLTFRVIYDLTRLMTQTLFYVELHFRIHSL